MRIEHAVYGEANGGHALLVFSGDGRIAAELTSRLDLPDTAPPGVEWSPFLSGFAHGDQYVVARTILDVAAPRAGMVFTHAIIAPLDEIVMTRNLLPLIGLLSKAPNRSPTLGATEVEVADETLPLQSFDLADAAEALTIRGAGPVVRLGHVGFDDLIVAIWARLWPEIRRGFAFRLSFGPSDLVEMPMPTVVCTPPSLAARWADYRVIGVVRQSASPLAAALLRGDEQGRTLLQFAGEIGASTATFVDLSLLEQAYHFGAGSSQPIEHVVTTLRLIERLSPNPAVGRDRKDELLTKLCRHLPTATAQQVLVLRNLNLEAVDDPERLWKALAQWVAENLYPANEDAAMLAVLENATSSHKAVDEWRDAVLAGVAAASRLGRPRFAIAFWRWAMARPELTASVFRHLPVEPDIEERLSDAAPARLEVSAAEVVAETSLSRKWVRLHGAVLSAAYGPLEAVRRQLAVDSGSSSLDGLRKALRHSTGAEKLACALTLDEPRLDRLASEAVAADPSLLSSINVAMLPAQRIWALALTTNQSAWQGPEKPHAAFGVVLDEMLKGKPTHLALIDELSLSPLADLSLYPQRSRVWSHVNTATRENLLASTASGWVNRASHGSMLPTPERELQSAILSGRTLDTILDALVPSRITAATELIATLDEFKEGRFVDWLRRVVSTGTAVSEPDAEAIGRLISNRRWTRAADELVSVGHHRADIVAALRICSGLLGLWTRFRLGLSRISAAEKWSLLEDAATELYPHGPDDEALWERAGGDDADLQHSGSGRSRWHDALVRIERGDRMPVERLLRQMRHDYPNNEKVRYLADDREFGGGLV
jgi:hypothetical protein